ncbi:hypothetical protein [Algibacter aquimarinus]|uniref:TonB C-terminal domain-containing protein n=1 Tax=Algibacter aquimarinus TaxID=1136748 RepID=A0ABP9HCP4_9FLAO
MKIQAYITILLLVLIDLSSNAQVNPIIFSSDDKYNIYKTSLYDQQLVNKNSQTSINKTLFENNTTVKYKINSGFTSDFFASVLTSTNYNSLNSKSTREGLFKVRYIVDEAGNVLSCSLHFPKHLLVLSNSEIESILTEAMTHKFNYFNKPNTINNFYFLFDINLAI